jgi:hypothetical protein
MSGIEAGGVLVDEALQLYIRREDPALKRR